MRIDSVTEHVFKVLLTDRETIKEISTLTGLEDPIDQYRKIQISRGSNIISKLDFVDMELLFHLLEIYSAIINENILRSRRLI